jgi:hypothetical protein
MGFFVIGIVVGVFVSTCVCNNFSFVNLYMLRTYIMHCRYTDAPARARPGRHGGKLFFLFFFGLVCAINDCTNNSLIILIYFACYKVYVIFVFFMLCVLC